VKGARDARLIDRFFLDHGDPIWGSDGGSCVATTNQDETFGSFPLGDDHPNERVSNNPDLIRPSGSRDMSHSRDCYCGSFVNRQETCARTS